MRGGTASISSVATGITLMILCGPVSSAARPPEAATHTQSEPEDSSPETSPPEPAKPEPANTSPWRPLVAPSPMGYGASPVAPDALLDDWIGQSRARQIREARFRLLLHTPHHAGGFDGGWRDPEDLEDYEDVVLSAWGKMVREAVEDAIGIDAWWDRKTGRERRRASKRDEEPSWNLRVSPRVADDRIGIKLRLPYTGIGFWNSFSFRYRYDWDENQEQWVLKFDDGARFINLGFEPDSKDFGDQLTLSVRLAW